MTTTARMSVALAELRGLWRRSMIAWPDGGRDTTTRVFWLQGMHACIDLRQPEALCPPVASGPPSQFGAVSALEDLSIMQCAQLAQQQGFAGQLEFNGKHYKWSRSIDFQPASVNADAGSLSWQGEMLVETGCDLAYVEHWHRDRPAATLPAAAIALRDADEHILAALLRVGAHFMFARDRAARASGGTLSDCVVGAATLRQARALVDCEISFGHVGASGFRIAASTLPWRIGAALEPQLLHGWINTVDCAPNGAMRRRRWQIIDGEGELESACGSTAAGVPQ